MEAIRRALDRLLAGTAEDVDRALMRDAIAAEQLEHFGASLNH